MQVAIIRPGPIVGKMVHPYLNRRQGREAAGLPASVARAGAAAHARRAAVSGAVAAHGDDRGRLHRRRRPRNCAAPWASNARRSAWRDIEVKLRAGMDRNGITGEAQDTIVQSITSFALYGFPESHAASFALLAYASAYLKCHYLAAFTCAMLNNQPMGFYPPAILMKDAQRHGLRVLPVDVQHSGLGLHDRRRRSSAPAPRAALCQRPARRGRPRHRARARPFTSVDDLARPRPATAQGRDEPAGGDRRAESARQIAPPRRALAGAARDPPVGPLLEPLEENGDAARRSRRMTTEERLWADFRGTG